MRSLARARLQRVRDVAANRLNCRSETRDQCDADGDHRGEEDGAAVAHDRVRVLRIEKERAQRSAAPLRNGQPGHSTQKGEHKTLGQQLLH